MGRTDLFILWLLSNGTNQQFVIECKIQRGTREKTIEAGVTQVTRYTDTCRAEGVYLVIFDPSDKPWDDKIFTEIRSKDPYQVEIFGM